MKPVTKEAYALVRTFLAAGASAWEAWSAGGGGKWPKTNPPASEMAAFIFDYVPAMSVGVDGDDNCPSEEDRRSGAACLAMTYSNMFRPSNIAAMRAALDARTAPDVLAAFDEVPDDGGDLEWWATALTSGVLIAIGGVLAAIGGGPWLIGASVAKVAGYLLAAWSVYGFITPKTPGGKSLAQKYAGLVADAAASVGGWLKTAVLGGGLVLVLYLAFRR